MLNDLLTFRSFINAPHARAKLQIDREMFVRLLSYHQVMPSFLDFVFCFGEQHRAKDYQFCGFRSRNDLDLGRPRLELRSRGRSGRIYEMCYSLRSAEKGRDAGWPWSIRQCALYHSYDVETEAATWIVIKANKVIQSRIRALVGSDGLSASLEGSEASSSLHWTLETHSLVSSWAAEQWHRYINFLEERFQQVSDQALTESIDIVSVKMEMAIHQSANRAELASEKTTTRKTSFDQLQDVHFIEEQINEALLVVRADGDVLVELGLFYAEIADRTQQEKRPEDQRLADIEAFSRELRQRQSQLTMQKHRLEALFGLVQGRKSLVSDTSNDQSSMSDCLINDSQLRSTLQHRSILMNFVLASEAQTSAKHVERMTKQMHGIARSTKVETVSMRIITFVTLVYLPGTFVSVSPLPIPKCDGDRADFFGCGL